MNETTSIDSWFLGQVCIPYINLLTHAYSYTLHLEGQNMSITWRGRPFYTLSIINCTRACMKSQVITYAITLKKRAQSINTGALRGVLRYHWLPTSDLTSVNTRSTWTLTVRNAWARKRKECSQWKDFFLFLLIC